MTAAPMWKVSQFTVVRDLVDHGLATHALVFNTLSGQCVLVEHDRWRQIADGLTGNGRTPPEVKAAIERLAAGGILIGADVDERRSYQSTFDEMRFDSPYIFPIFAVTTNCNIGCTYCYEEGVVGKKMSDDVVAGVLRWVERRIVYDGVRQVYPSLFGGEPLMYPKVLFALMDGLAELSERYDVDHWFTSSSNGTLLTPDLAQTLAEKGLRQIQISLDGPEHSHDERRIGKRGQPSFEPSLRGIRTAIDWIPNVTVKVNFDRHNREAIAELYDFLVEEDLASRVDVKLETVAYQFGSGTVHDPAFVIPPESPELADAYLELMIEAQRRGIRVNRETAHTTPCMFTADHAVIIGPDGNIYKCISLVGRDEFRVGTVFEDDYLETEYALQMDNVKRTEECWEEACPYIPVCAGGCAYESIVRTGRYDVRFCTKDYLAAWHYKRYLLKYEERLQELGVAALSPAVLRQTAEAVQAQLPMVGSGCGDGCGSGPREQSLLQIGNLAGTGAPAAPGP